MSRILAFVLIAMIAASSWAQEDEFVIIPRSEVLQIISELNRLRGEINKLNNRLIGCTA